MLTMIVLIAFGLVLLIVLLAIIATIIHTAQEGSYPFTVIFIVLGLFWVILVCCALAILFPNLA
jgi:hypothetical protein